MNYDKIKNIFADLYKELCDTFDDFAYDFSELVGQPIPVYDESTKLEEYFLEITQSIETIEKFIKEQLAPAVKARQKFDVSSSYHYIMAKEARTSNIEAGRNTKVNYAAFKRTLLGNFGLTQRDIHELIRTAF
jgi:hypothetical protein